MCILTFIIQRSSRSKFKYLFKLKEYNMKFFSITSALLLFMIMPLMAQEEQDDTQVQEEVEETVDETLNYVDRNFNFGIKAGLNFSTFNDDKIFNADAQTRLHLGVFGRYRFTQRISLQAELLYSMKGARADEFSIFEEYSVDLDYLSLPVLVQFALGDKVNLELGPYVAVLVSSRQSFGDLNTDLETFDVSEDEVNYVDAGLAGGVVYTASSGFGVGLRYSQGFADALGEDFFRSASGANSVIQLSAYYNF